MPIDADLDHVALAAEDVALLWPRYAGELGGVWQGGGDTAGFYSAQVAYTNGMKVEGLHPYLVEENDFLRRFLDQNGPGPHHVTFKVADIAAAIAEAEATGRPPVGVDLSNPGWQEAFLHPKVAYGIVVQLAHSDGSGDWGVGEAPTGFDVGPTATLLHLHHLVADVDGARSLFAGLLGGQVTDEGDRSVSLAWPGPGRIVLAEPADEAERAWLGARPGRLHHLAFAVDEPLGVTGALDRGDGTAEVPPEDNLGVRLRLLPR